MKIRAQSQVFACQCDDSLDLILCTVFGIMLLIFHHEVFTLVKMVTMLILG
jgi:hypothetical protein